MAKAAHAVKVLGQPDRFVANRLRVNLASQREVIDVPRRHDVFGIDLFGPRQARPGSQHEHRAAMMGTVLEDESVASLVSRAKDGDQRAWDKIVERFAPLVWAMCRRHNLTRPDADDVGAAVWLRLVERLHTIREPAALAGWLATTTRRECLRALRAKSRELLVEDHHSMVDDTTPAADEWLLAQERHIAVRAAFATLSERCRQLLEMLFSDPVTPYAEISAALGMPVGAIGPTRRRCLDKLRASSSLTALMVRP